MGVPLPPKLEVGESTERNGWRYTRVSEDEVRCEPLSGTPMDNEQQLRTKLREARADIRKKPAAARTPLERTQANLIALMLGEFDSPPD